VNLASPFSEFFLSAKSRGMDIHLLSEIFLANGTREEPTEGMKLPESFLLVLVAGNCGVVESHFVENVPVHLEAVLEGHLDVVELGVGEDFSLAVLGVVAHLLEGLVHVALHLVVLPPVALLLLPNDVVEVLEVVAPLTVESQHVVVGNGLGGGLVLLLRVYAPGVIGLRRLELLLALGQAQGQRVLEEGLVVLPGAERIGVSLLGVAGLASVPVYSAVGVNILRAFKENIVVSRSDSLFCCGVVDNLVLELLGVHLIV